MDSCTPADVLSLKGPTKSFLCPLTANTYGIEFLSFTITDYDSKKTIFEVSRDRPLPLDLNITQLDEDSLRKINYEFSEDVLKLPKIMTTLVFSVGPQEVRDFRMIERHYFGNQLIKSYDFTFGFCIPGSTNTWEAVYAMPPLDSDLVDSMIENPYDASSDSFYFVGDKLIMHNKAYYKYVVEDATAQSKSYDKYNPGHKGAKGAKGAKVEGEEGAKGAKGEKASAKTGGGEEEEEEDPGCWSKEDDYI